MDFFLKMKKNFKDGKIFKDGKKIKDGIYF